jgi:YD repeat-containing protein
VIVDHSDGSFTSYAYDALGRMTGATLNGVSVATIGYDALSRRSGITFADTSSQSYTYDLADRLTTLSHVFPGSLANQQITVTLYELAAMLPASPSGVPPWLASPGSLFPASRIT